MHTLFQEEDAPAPENAPRRAVLVPYPVDKAYDYALPPGMNCQPGDYVTVPLGAREVTGVVWGEGTGDAAPKKIKEIIACFDVPPMAQAQRKFIDWAAHYIMAPKGAVLKLSLSVPGALKPEKPAKGYIAARPSPQPSPRGGEGGAASAAEGEEVYSPKPRAGMIQNARTLRVNQTDVEKRLWRKLRDRQLDGHKFKRQHPIAPYIADFVCLEKRLIVEADGGQHNEEADKKRTAFLESQGYRVLRFWNNEVLENIDGVLETIQKTLRETPSPQPSPRRGEGGAALAAEGEGDYWGSLSPPARRVMEIAADGMPRRASELAHEAGCSAGVIKTLAEKGYLSETDIFSGAPCRHPDPVRKGALLSDAQQKAASALINAVQKNAYSAALLDGVTGSGKTEVYFEAVAEALRADKQVLILLPEIALSNAFIDRFKERFGCYPALWHSSLSDGQRKTTWRGVATGESRVIVGARSALFLPYADLGLVIVDEEHDPAYKQEEGVIYNARDMAVVRAHIGKIPVVLVSATPSLETMQNTWDGKYTHLSLPDRHGGAGMPDVHLIDMKKEQIDKQHFIAPTLKTALQETLEKEGQSLLFLNRRGYAPLTLCRTCGHRFECPRCSAWLIEHRKTGKLHCHHCGYDIKIPEKCPSCGEADTLAACGPGVERVFEEVKDYFPDARIKILSSDTATTHDDLKEILRDIRDHKIDIIIGTQIIAKGHHFPKLTCVGVVDADLGLTGGDLRATERTFQLLHQVAGRAGREAEKGAVYLQTFTPEGRVMQALADGQRDAFLEVEASERESARMPPFTRLAGIIVSGRDEKQVLEVSKELGMSAPNGPGINTLGPADAPMYRLRGKYRRRLLVRADKTIDMQKAIAVWLKNVHTPSTVRVQVDIDPQSFF